MFSSTRLITNRALRLTAQLTPINTSVYLGTAASHNIHSGYRYLCSSTHSEKDQLKYSAKAKLRRIAVSKYFCRKSTTMTSVPEGVLLGLGNPLLDITITEDEAFLKKYGLEANNAIEADESHHAMFDDIVNHHNPTYIAGGANQNTIRVAQWMLQRPHATTFFGCVGNDGRGETMRKKTEEVGVRVVYQIDEKEATGVCAAIITGENRSLVSHLGAAMHFKVEFLTRPENWSLVEKAQCFYMCGFPFTVTPESILKIAQHASDTNKTLVMNLSAPYLCKYYADPEYKIMEHTDILFGNETEAAYFCKLMGLPTEDIKQMALDVSSLKKKNEKKQRMVIFTQGRDPTIVAHDGIVEEHPVKAVEKSLIKDTNGCGDAFVGGFLSQYVQDKTLPDCLRCGRYAARTIIQQWGCTYPQKPDFQ